MFMCFTGLWINRGMQLIRIGRIPAVGGKGCYESLQNLCDTWSIYHSGCHDPVWDLYGTAATKQADQPVLHWLDDQSYFFVAMRHVPLVSMGKNWYTLAVCIHVYSRVYSRLCLSAVCALLSVGYFDAKRLQTTDPAGSCMGDLCCYVCSLDDVL